MSYVQFHDNLYFNSLHPFTISIFGGTVQIICQKYIYKCLLYCQSCQQKNAIDYIRGEGRGRRKEEEDKEIKERGGY